MKQQHQGLDKCAAVGEFVERQKTTTTTTTLLGVLAPWRDS
jgi:hypothetical protein